MCVCLSICLSVCLSPLPSEITFDPMVRLWSNFHGQPNSLQVIFGQAVWIPEPSGSGLDFEKGGFLQINLLPRFWARGVVSYPFRNQKTRQKNAGANRLFKLSIKITSFTHNIGCVSRTTLEKQSGCGHRQLAVPSLIRLRALNQVDQLKSVRPLIHLPPISQIAFLETSHWSLLAIHMFYPVKKQHNIFTQPCNFVIKVQLYLVGPEYVQLDQFLH